MKKTILSLSGVAVITATLLSTSVLEFSATSVGSTTSGANVAFQPKKTPTNPVYHLAMVKRQLVQLGQEFLILQILLLQMMD